MKTKIVQAVTLLLFSKFSIAQGLQVQAGATFKPTGTVSIVIQDGSLTNNGTSDLSGSNIYFTGTGAGTLGGTANLNLNNLYINRPAATVTLGHDASVANQVVMQGGLLDLNGKTITLSASGSLSGESEANRIMGPSGGEVQITLPLNAPLAANPGNLGAIINSAADMGTVTIKRGHKFYTNVLGANSIERYYDISPTNNTNLGAFFRFNYFDAELNSLNESNLKMFRSTDNGVSWTDQGFSGRNTTSNFVDLSGINSFSKWTLSSAVALPITLSHFKANCSAGQIATEWETFTEVNSDKFLIERSADARQWEIIGTLPAKGNSVAAQTYRFSDPHPLGSYAFYRLQQVDKDGKVSYSSVMGAGCSGGPSFGLAIYPNPVTDFLKVRMISPSASTGDVSIYNAGGQLLQTRSVNLLIGVNVVAIKMTNYPKGTYKLVLTMDGQQKQTEKVFKQ